MLYWYLRFGGAEMHRHCAVGMLSRREVTERVIIDEVYDNDESPTPTVEPTISPTSSPKAENSEKIQNKPTADKQMTQKKK